jgi:hypothetical protein
MDTIGSDEERCISSYKNCWAFFLKHNSRPDLTSCWHPQLKLISRGLAGISAALYRV